MSVFKGLGARSATFVTPEPRSLGAADAVRGRAYERPSPLSKQNTYCICCNIRGSAGTGPERDLNRGCEDQPPCTRLRFAEFDYPPTDEQGALLEEGAPAVLGFGGFRVARKELGALTQPFLIRARDAASLVLGFYAADKIARDAPPGPAGDQLRGSC